MKLVKSEDIIFGVKCLWKFGNQKSLSFLPLYVINSSCNVWKGSLPHHSLPESYSRGSNALPLAPLLVWNYFYNHLESPLCLSEASGWHSGPLIRPTHFKVQQICFGKATRLERCYGHKCALWHAPQRSLRCCRANCLSMDFHESIWGEILGVNRSLLFSLIHYIWGVNN